MTEKSNYSTNWKVYTTIKEIQDEEEYPLVFQSIKNVLSEKNTDELKTILKYLTNG